MSKITYCPPIHECDACKEIINTDCVKYTKDNTDCYNKGNTLTTILNNLCNGQSTSSSSCNCCVTLERNGSYPPTDNNPLGYFYEFKSCCSDSTSKTYAIRDASWQNLYTGSLSGAQTYAETELETDTAYHIIEFELSGQTVICESAPVGFEILTLANGGQTFNKIFPCNDINIHTVKYTLSSAQLLDLQNTPVEVIPNALPNQYIELVWGKAQLLYGTTPYSWADSTGTFYIHPSTYPIYPHLLVSGRIALQTYDAIYRAYFQIQSDEYYIYNGVSISIDGAPSGLIDGDSELLLILKYRIRTT